MARYVPKHRRSDSPLSEVKFKEKENPTKKATPQKNKNKKLVEIVKNISSQKKTTTLEATAPNNGIPLKPPASNSPPEEQSHYNYMKYAEKISFDILTISVDDLKKRQLKLKESKRSSERYQVQLDRVLPEIAANFVNLAIENAMQLLKSVKLYEKRNSCVVENLEVNRNQITPDKEIQPEKSESLVEDENKLQLNKDKERQSEKIKNCTKDENSIDKAAPDISSKELTITKQSQEKQTKTKSKTSKKTNSKKTKKLKNKQQNNDAKVDREEEPKIAPTTTNNQLPVKIMTTKEEEIFCDDEMKDDLDDWDSNWTEDGECISEELKNEVKIMIIYIFYLSMFTQDKLVNV